VTRENAVSYDPAGTRERTDALDPDWDDVPEDMRQIGGTTYLVHVDEDGKQIELATHAAAPQLWAHSRRLQEQDGDG
jgi:hypothetical protein